MKGFQQTNTTRYIYAPTQAFNGFNKYGFSENQSPYIVDDSLYAWWDTQTGVVLNVIGSATTVSSWTDKINGYSFTQGSATNQPTYIISDPNYRGYPSINFSTSSGNLMSAGNILNLGTLAGFTIMMVSSCFNNLRSGMIKGNGNSAVIGDWGLNYGTPQNNITFKDASGGVNLRTCDTGNINTILGLTIDRTKGVATSYCASSGSGAFPITTGNISTALTNLNSNDVLYLNGVNTSYGNGMGVLEIIAYTRALTQTEMNQNFRNLKSKYGIWTTT